MIEKLYQFLNSFTHLFGVDFRRFPTRDQRRVLHYLKEQQVDCCIDVGANEGQFAKDFRSMGFKGEIYSFEPQSAVYEILKRKSKADNKWHALNFAIGEVEETTEINISKNTYSSSLLEILPAHTDASPDSSFIGKEKITVKRLDKILPSLIGTKKFYLKIDTQGYESKVLNGCLELLPQIAGIQLEIPCVPLYKNELLFDEMKKRIESYQFFLSSIESGFAETKSARLLQVEAIFLKNYN